MKHPIYNCQFWSYHQKKFLTYDEWLKETWQVTMAKFTRHDPRNKKRNKHKNFSKNGYSRDHFGEEYKRKGKYEKFDISVPNTE